ncbi:MAG TPA: 2-oxoacid:acceptor oxidoreductase subunit alpha [Patescibacteria group bacterium]|nr:2-oxoacid:acceptor oxidoreductase subunit alpha [Patescibacteria group bacterium]
MKNRFAIKISGPAGAGMMQAGETLSKALNRLGFFSLMYPEYPSRIRGGDNHVQVVFSSRQFLSPQEKVNLLLAFGLDNLLAHQDEVIEGGLNFEAGDIGLGGIADKLGNPLVANSAALGFLWAVLGFDLPVLKEQLAEDFAEKKTIKDLNLKAAVAGFEKAKDIWGMAKVKTKGIKGKISNLSGNEALTQGILAAECSFAAIYPMTPINSILSMLAKTKVNLFRPEDEIAGINAAIGAAYAGGRAMVATSGGGFSLMVEALGMAGAAEVPVVIVVGQRTGPSTGMATFSSQADLNFVINAGHGEFPRIVLTPGDLEESYRLGAEAFNLAERYQVPVILLTDKYLAESCFSRLKEILDKVVVRIDRGKLFDGKGEYRRYALTLDGISPRAFPGQTVFLTNSYEHDEYGFSTDEVGIREEMMAKRGRKLIGLKGGVEKYGEEGAETTLVGWGSTKEILLDFITTHPDYNLVHFWRPWPFPKEAEEILRQAKKLIVVEGNFSGQLVDLIEKETGLRPKRVLKDNGRPFYKEELARLLK